MDSGCRFFTTQKVDGAFKMQYLNHYGANSHLNIRIAHTHHPTKKRANASVSKVEFLCFPQFVLFFYIYMAMNRAREEKKNAGKVSNRTTEEDPPVFLSNYYIVKQMFQQQAFKFHFVL